MEGGRLYLLYAHRQGKRNHAGRRWIRMRIVPRGCLANDRRQRVGQSGNSTTWVYLLLQRHTVSLAETVQLYSLLAQPPARRDHPS